MSGLIYVDTSALVKHVLEEHESEALARATEGRSAIGSQFVTSTLTRVELGRTLRRRLEGADVPVDSLYAAALRGVGQAQLTDVVLELARSIEPPVLRSLDAIHLATAIALGCHEVWTYDDRLADGAMARGMTVRAPV